MTEPDDSDDEFFGNQDILANNDEFGALEQRERRAREESLKTVGFVESYDDAKDVRLQEGFEVGYRETYDVALRLGTVLGKEAVQNLLSNSSGANETSLPQQTDTMARQVREFLNNFERRSSDDNLDQATESLEMLLGQLEEYSSEPTNR